MTFKSKFLTIKDAAIELGFTDQMSVWDMIRDGIVRPVTHIKSTHSKDSYLYVPNDIYDYFMIRDDNTPDELPLYSLENNEFKYVDHYNVFKKDLRIMRLDLDRVKSNQEINYDLPSPLRQAEINYAKEIFKHSTDYSRVTLHGVTYRLNKPQQKIVEFLHEMFHENKDPVSEEGIEKAVTGKSVYTSESFIHDKFKKHEIKNIKNILFKKDGKKTYSLNIRK